MGVPCALSPARLRLEVAARYFAEKNPPFAIETGMMALHWLVEGYSYEVTGLDVHSAYSYTMHAAENGGCVEQTQRRIRDLITSKRLGEHFVTKILSRQLGLS